MPILPDSIPSQVSTDESSETSSTPRSDKISQDGSPTAKWITHRGRILDREANVELLLRTSGTVLRLNVITSSYEWVRLPPWRREGDTCEFREVDAQHCQYYAHQRWAADFSTRTIKSAFTALGLSSEYSPVAEWLRTIAPTWDGVSRAAQWLPVVFGSPDQPWCRLISERFLIAACMRALIPGIKYDNILVIRGPQGYKKSTAISLLPPHREWYSDNKFETSKDGVMQDSACWIRELPELAGFKKLDPDTIKQYTSQDSTKIRPPYGSVLKEYYRRAVYIASTNDEFFLHDPTGNRRYIITDCTRMTDTDWLVANREQMWAEAATRALENMSIYTKNRDNTNFYPHKFWIDSLDNEVYTQVTIAQHAAMEESMVLARLQQWIEDNKVIAVTYAEACKQLQIPVTAHQSRTGRDLSSAFRTLGWTATVVRGVPQRRLKCTPATRDRLERALASKKSASYLTESDLKEIEQEVRN